MNDFIGTEGNDVLLRARQDDSTAGGAGDDTAVFSGRSVDYPIIESEGGTEIFTDMQSGYDDDGVDTLINIERWNSPTPRGCWKG